MKNIGPIWQQTNTDTRQAALSHLEKVTQTVLRVLAYPEGALNTSKYLEGREFEIIIKVLKYRS